MNKYCAVSMATLLLAFLLACNSDSNKAKATATPPPTADADSSFNWTVVKVGPDSVDAVRLDADPGTKQYFYVDSTVSNFRPMQLWALTGWPPMPYPWSLHLRFMPTNPFTFVPQYFDPGTQSWKFFKNASVGVINDIPGSKCTATFTQPHAPVCSIQINMSASATGNR